MNKMLPCNDFLLCCRFSPWLGGSGCKLEFVAQVLSTSGFCILQVTSENETEDAQLPQVLCT